MRMEEETRGWYGYIEAHKKSQLIKTGIGAAIVLVLMVLGYILLGERNWLLIPAMLAVIPTANAFVAYAAFSKFQTAPRDKYEMLGHFENAGMLLSDLVLVDEKGKRMPVEFVVIYKNGVVGWSSYCGTRFRPEAAEIPVNDTLKRRGIPMRFKVYGDWDEFLKRIDQVEPAGDEAEKQRIKLAREAVISRSM